MCTYSPLPAACSAAQPLADCFEIAYYCVRNSQVRACIAGCRCVRIIGTEPAVAERTIT